MKIQDLIHLLIKVNGILNPDFREDLYNYQVEIPTEVTKINLELLKKFFN